jgi:hypothetical protein
MWRFQRHHPTRGDQAVVDRTLAGQTRVNVGLLIRDKQAKQVYVKLAMNIPVRRDLRNFGIDRLHLNSLENLRDIWSRVQQAAPLSIGNPEYYK